MARDRPGFEEWWLFVESNPLIIAAPEGTGQMSEHLPNSWARQQFIRFALWQNRKRGLIVTVAARSFIDCLGEGAG